MSSRRLWFFAILFAYAVFCRVLPYILATMGMSIAPATTWYPWNFSPLMAISLFGGAMMAERRWSLLLPLGVMVASDFGILLLTGDPDFVFRPSQPLIYGCFALAAVGGWVLRSRPQVMTAIPLAIISEVLFFLITNFAVWFFGEGENYPMNLQGLSLCYTMGLPFLRRSLISTSMYALVLFSPVGLAMAARPAATPVNEADKATSAS